MLTTVSMSLLDSRPI